MKTLTDVIGLLICKTVIHNIARPEFRTFGTSCGEENDLLGPLIGSDFARIPIIIGTRIRTLRFRHIAGIILFAAKNAIKGLPMNELDYELILGQLLKLLPFAFHFFLTSLHVLNSRIAEG